MEIRIWGGVIELCGDMAISITLYWSRFRPGLSQSFRGVIWLLYYSILVTGVYLQCGAVHRYTAMVFFYHIL